MICVHFLPNELIENIIRFMDLQSIVNLGLLNKKMHAFVDDGRIKNKYIWTNEYYTKNIIYNIRKTRKECRESVGVSVFSGQCLKGLLVIRNRNSLKFYTRQFDTDTLQKALPNTSTFLVEQSSTYFNVMF